MTISGIYAGEYKETKSGFSPPKKQLNFWLKPLFWFLEHRHKCRR